MTNEAGRLTETVYSDRSERGKLRLTGEQRAWFLHQILTNSFEDIVPGEAREAALLTHHGRMLGYLEVLALENELLVHFEPGLREALPEALTNYIFATRVEIEDLTDDMGLLLVAGPGWRQIAYGAFPSAPAHPTLGLGEEAGYLWVPRPELGEAHAALLGAGARQATEDELEAIRIANGVGRWGKDMNEKTLPQEACIEGRAIHFDKGCYVGQEAIAKIHFRGKVNRLLRRLDAESPLEVGAEVKLGDDAVGIVTSAAATDALAMLRYTVEPGAVVSVGGTAATVAA